MMRDPKFWIIGAFLCACAVVIGSLITPAHAHGEWVPTSVTQAQHQHEIIRLLQIICEAQAPDCGEAHQ